METFYYDDFSVGDQWKSPARTITETDIVMFAGLTGDYNPAHTDEVFASEGPLGRRILHGVAGLSFAIGLEQRVGLKDGGGALLLLGVTWDFKAPIFIGDTVHVSETVSKKRLSSKNPSRGVVHFDVALINQRNETVQAGEWKLMYNVKSSRES